MADADSFLSMNSNQSSRRAGAFTLVELLCVIAIIGILAALLLPVLNQSQARVKRIECENNLHQLGIAYQVFSHDHNDKFPMAVPIAEGGSQEFVQNGYAVGGEFYFAYHHFQALSNELSSPAILVCPADTRLAATNFAALQNRNISYCIGVCARPSRPDSILAGDRNLKIGSSESTTIVPCRADANTTLQWTREMHQFKGNILFAGGQVEEWNNAKLVGAGSQQAGADLFMPSVLPTPNAPTPATAGYQNYSGANPGVATPPPPSTATPAPPPAPPPARPPNNPSGGQSRFSQEITGPGTQSLSDVARTNSPDSLSTNSPARGTVTPIEPGSATSAFDQHIVKILRGIIIWTYLLVLLIFLLLLALKSWQRAQRKREQRKNQG
jgi:prepilin-type N-terminal cleavage/methylation domain-containing protein